MELVLELRAKKEVSLPNGCNIFFKEENCTIWGEGPGGILEFFYEGAPEKAEPLINHWLKVSAKHS